jgi:hypothetical protein
VLIQQIFEGFFTEAGVPYEVIPFSETGGSDYHPFIYNGERGSSTSVCTLPCEPFERRYG